MGMSLLEWLEISTTSPEITKGDFGEMMWSNDPEQVEKALKALEDCGGYDNLPD